MLLTLAVLGIVEAVVWLFRMRTARHPSAIVSGIAAFLVTVTRLLFVYLGASAAMSSLPIWECVAAYAIPATLATVAAHHWAEGKPA